MVKTLITIIRVNSVPRRRQHLIVVLKKFAITLPSQPSLGLHLGLNIFFHNGFLHGHTFFTAGLFVTVLIYSVLFTQYKNTFYCIKKKKSMQYICEMCCVIIATFHLICNYYIIVMKWLLDYKIKSRTAPILLENIWKITMVKAKCTMLENEWNFGKKLLLKDWSLLYCIWHNGDRRQLMLIGKVLKYQYTYSNRAFTMLNYCN